ncbi:MAG: hypothetical protein OEW19_07970, partial [Acidobacteriota bacterium]|nr:hypothetical protein [Acidobacteriota bacterium]
MSPAVFGQPSRQRRRRSTAAILALALCVLAGGAATPIAQSRGASGPPAGASARAHVDVQLAARLSRADDTAREKVIITVKPGAKRGLIQALMAQGATVSADFTIIEAFAADMPVGLLRALQQHPDVVAISTDAGVAASGLSTNVSGAPMNSAYTLRRTLGLDVGPAQIQVGTRTTTYGTGAQLAWWHTVDAGSNRFLLVEVGVYASRRVPAVTAVTYGGVPLTKIMNASGGSTASVELWYLTAPAAGTALVNVTMKQTAAVAAGATSFVGVRQLQPFGADSWAASGTGSTKAITVPSATGDLVV